MSEPTEEPTTAEETAAEEPKPTPAASAVEEKVRTGIRPRTAKRLAIMAVLLVGISYALYWFVGQKGDIIFPIDSSKMIAALKLDEGSQAVVIDPSGKVTASSGYTAENTDRDLAWQPDGNRLFFISDRMNSGYQIFRWNPASNGDPDQRSVDRASRSDLSFDAQETGKGDLMGLVIVRGTVHRFEPKTSKSTPVMPPSKQTSSDPEGGQTGTFEVLYKRYGQSFKTARWFGHRRYIAAVMKREDRGESLIVQDSEPDDQGRMRPPRLVFIAEKINIAVDPVSGGLVFTLTDVLPILDDQGNPVEGPDGKPIKYGFNHAILRTVDQGGNLGMQMIGASPSKELCFASPVVSPDGNSMMFLAGKYKGEGNMEVTSLNSCPFVENGIQGASLLVPGIVTDPTFSPNGRQIAFVKEDGGKQAIFLATSNGSDVKNLTGSSGNFATPLFSPQYK
ncbi:MAG: PD40 domain-containing protein [Armatimonadetes bacterium]|nr:PD40 domain-containing protein [Armatimonadota bacterium]